MRYAPAIFVLAATLIASNAHAQAKRIFPPGENLLVSMPDDWKLGHQVERERVRSQEFVHTSQTMLTWTRLVTAQVHDVPHPADAFVDALGALFKRQCPNTQIQPYAQKDIDGLPARRVFFRTAACVAGAESNLVLAVRGRAKLYVLLYGWRPDPPTAAELQEGQALLNGARVCDTAANTCEALALFTDGYKGGHTDQKVIWERSMTAAREAIARDRSADAEAALKDAVVEARRLTPDTTSLRATYVELGQLYRKLGRVTDAVDADDRAAKLTSTKPSATTPSAAKPSTKPSSTKPSAAAPSD